MNVISVEDLFDDDLYKELYMDMYEECSKFGEIELIEILRPDFITGLASPSVGKVFVKFRYLIPAKKARHNLSGRTYNNRTVVASFYPESLF